MDAAEAPKKPACRCGYTIGHHMVSDQPEYNFIGWVAVMVGISARPTLIRYRCRRCDQVFHATRDPAVLAKHY
jgi:hypothetical protein